MTDMGADDLLHLVIRDEAAGDEGPIDAVLGAAFRDHPFSRQTEAAIVRALRHDGALRLSLVATIDGAVVGHLACSAVRIQGQDQGWCGLGPIGVLPGRQRAGIGSALVRNALRRLAGRGVPGCVVLGDPAWYGRFGFAARPGLVLPGAPPAHFLALALTGPVPQGQVAFHPAFAAPG
jgi:putative acetyltransferase